MPYTIETTSSKKRVYGFATFPDAMMYANPKMEPPFQHLIYGDYINLLPNSQSEIKEQDGFVFVRSRGQNGWVKADNIQEERVLEINMVDIGQGDGCHIVTPDNQQLIVNAGEADHMQRFLNWRYNLRKHNNRVHNITAIITHPDKHHYAGFLPLFQNPQMNFLNIFHNGIVERPGKISALGPLTKIRQKKFLSGIVEDDRSCKQLLNTSYEKGQQNYLNTLYQATTNKKNDALAFEMLHKGKGYVPGFEKGKKVTLEVLAPITEENEKGEKCLKSFSSSSATKKAHGIILMLTIGKLKILLGADLQSNAQNYVLKHFTGTDPGFIHKKLSKELDPRKRKKYEMELANMVLKGKKFFEAHIYKTCLHKHVSFSKEFLQTVSPLATIISSGDHESHPHPSPAALGAFGKFARGGQPLVFSTQFLRSTNETAKKPHQLRKGINFKTKELARENNPVLKDKIRDDIIQLNEKLERTIAVYGLVGIRTNGEKAIICQKLEKPKANGKKWDIYQLRYNKTLQEFEYTATQDQS